MSLCSYSVPGCHVEQVRQLDGELLLVVRSRREGAACPNCRRRSTASHSTYVRRPADLPSLGRGVRLVVHVRRFYGQNARCPRRTFAESFRGLLDPHAQRTRRLAAAQRRVAVQVGGEAGARLLTVLAMPTSPDSLLRLVRRAPLPVRRTPRVLGVDDWALKRGRRYGTILVDLEARHVVDLLPDRSAHALTAWLRPRRPVAVIARDRSTEYARAATMAAPHALQVADRWHLLANVRELAERWLMSVFPRLRRLPAPVGTPTATASTASPGRRDRAFPKTAAERQQSAASEARWRAVYDEVRRRHAAGESIMGISRALGVAHGTVRRFVRSAEFPARAPHRRQPSILDPYLGHLQARYADGCENSAQRWREIRTLGYPGRQKQVRRWRQERRRNHAPTAPRRYRRPLAPADAPARPSLPSPKQIAWLLIRPPERVPAAEAWPVHHLAQDAEAAVVIALGQRVAALLRNRDANACETTAGYDRWLDDALTCGVRAVATFARGLTQDGVAVRAAFTSPWSNGQTEGQITKLKLLKRQMYGRANLDLLRRRLLLAA